MAKAIILQCDKCCDMRNTGCFSSLSFSRFPPLSPLFLSLFLFFSSLQSLKAAWGQMTCFTSLFPSRGMLYKVLSITSIILLMFSTLDLGARWLLCVLFHYFFKFPALLRSNWQNYIYLKYTTWWLNTRVHCKIFITIKLINAHITLCS